MSYQIKYDPSRRRKFYTEKRKKIPGWLLIFAWVAVAVTIFNKELKDVLIPGDPHVTKAALSNLTDDLREGEPLKDAVAAFCKEILDGASVQN